MQLKVLLPTEVLVDEDVAQVNAEAANGAFSLLPRHVDFTATLVPGLLSYTREDGNEHFVAVDYGILVKVGDEVLVSVRNGTRGSDLETMNEVVENQFLALSREEEEANNALAKLETNFVRRFMELSERP